MSNKPSELERHMQAMADAVKTIADAVVFMKRMVTWLIFNDIIFAILIVIIFWKINSL